MGQVHALLRVGATEFVVEKVSGASDLPEVDALVARLKTGNSFAVTEISRLGRMMTGGFLLAGHQESRGIHLGNLYLAIVGTSRPVGIPVSMDGPGWRNSSVSSCTSGSAAASTSLVWQGNIWAAWPLLGATQAEAATQRLRANDVLRISAPDWRVSKHMLLRLIRKYAQGEPARTPR